MPASWEIRFTAKDGRTVDGSYIEKRWLWIFPQTPVTGELAEEMRFERYWINAIYSVKVCPGSDLIAEFD